VNVKPALCFILLTSLVIGALSPVFAQTSSDLRCDGGVVSVGDYASELLRKCGEPSYATQREQKIVEEGSLTGDHIITTIIIDDWTFNFGPNRFQCRILLRNGRIMKIEIMDYYGY
jgi:hypothetical protein